MGTHPKDLDLVLHIGLHKTASTYVQNVLSARRYDLIRQGLFYPNTGMHPEGSRRTRDGAQSGHALFAGRAIPKSLMRELVVEVPPATSTILLSAEDFSHPRVEPMHRIEQFGMFRTITVVAVVRRQDRWIESYYKQIVDQHGAFETRSFAEFLAQEGPRLLDFEKRLGPWRDLVGPENFHVLSYDDLADGDAICRRILEIAGVDPRPVERLPEVNAPRYDSVRAIDSVGLRILNGIRLSSRSVRDRAAREIYSAAPMGDIELMTSEMRKAICEKFAPVNATIETEWCAEPVPRFRFGDEEPADRAWLSEGELLDYIDRVLAVCRDALEQDQAESEVESTV